MNDFHSSHSSKLCIFSIYVYTITRCNKFYLNVGLEFFIFVLNVEIYFTEINMKFFHFFVF